MTLIVSIVGIVLVFVIMSSILSWINWSRTQTLEDVIWHLKDQIKTLSAGRTTAQAEIESVPEPEAPEAAPWPLYQQAPTPEPEQPWWQTSAKSYSSDATPDAEAQVSERPAPRSLEQQFGARLPVWIGGIALALAGFFMVKYSIDTGLLNETVRVVLGGVFGLGLLYGAHFVFSKPSLSNGTRIAQSLTSAGIADLYICLFAATNLYHLMPSWLGFMGMACVTGYAVIASLRYGAPIALLGLTGGFLTPALVHSNTPDGPLLFLYLYIVIAGLFAVIRKQGWWLCGVLAVGAAFLWVVVWIASEPLTSDASLWLGLFLLAVSATIVAASHDAIVEAGGDIRRLAKPITVVNCFGVGGAVALMAIVVDNEPFDPMSWALFGLLSAGGIMLAWFKPKLYGFVPLITLALTLVMLAAWPDITSTSFVVTIVVFASLYIASGGLLFHSDKPLFWAVLSAGAALCFYLLAYYKLRFVYTAETVDVPLWGGLAMALTGLSIYAAATMRDRFAQSERIQQNLLAVYATAATAFLSFGFFIEWPRDFLPVAIAVEVLAISWINTRLRVTALRMIAAVLAGVFAVLLIPQLLLLLQLTAYSLFETQLPLQQTLPMVDWPVFQLGLPALMFAGASWFLRYTKDDVLIKILEAAAIILLGLTGYYLTRHAFHAGENILFSKADLIERGVITNSLFVYGLACLAAGKYLRRSIAVSSGLILYAIAAFRIVYFDLAVYNPLWSHQFIGGLLFVNALALSFGLPLLWLGLAGRIDKIKMSSFAPYVKLFSLLLLFAFVSLNVTQLFHGAYLDIGAISNAEVYSYSVAWLLIGIGMLVVGTAKHDKLLRSASLAVMLLTVGKVFLYDASELTGLYRIFSFLGLGLSLLALSWFYTRFVFRDEPHAQRNA